jgi:hypothetical protein
MGQLNFAGLNLKPVNLEQGVSAHLFLWSKSNNNPPIAISFDLVALGSANLLINAGYFVELMVWMKAEKCELFRSLRSSRFGLNIYPVLHVMHSVNEPAKTIRCEDASLHVFQLCGYAGESKQDYGNLYRLVFDGRLMIV